MMKIWISCQKVDILKLHFFVSLPFKKYILKTNFLTKKKKMAVILGEKSYLVAM